jgi:uncharacterized protein (TIGR03382 family)
MKKNIVLTLTATLALGFAATTQAQTIAGYNFQASLVDLTDTSAAPGAGATDLAYATDNSIYTVIANLGFYGGTGFGGTFGGGSYTHGSGADIIITTLGEGDTTVSGSFLVSLMLANGDLTPGITYSDANFILADDLESFSYVQADGGGPTTSDFSSWYLPLSIADFDTGGQGVTGIEFNDFTSAYLDLGYVGVTTLASTNVPEPSTLALAGLGGLARLFHRRK